MYYLTILCTILRTCIC